MTMDEHQKKAFDFAVDLTKQLITLSTAIITLTVTFSKDIVGSIESSNRVWLLISWVIFIISILCGLLTLMALTGNLDPIPRRKKKADGSIEKVKPVPNLTITSSNITATAQLQIWSFMLALGMTCWYGYKATSSISNKNQNPKNAYMVIRRSQLESDSTVHIDTLYLPQKK